MKILMDMIWVEWRKAFRSRMPLWTGLVAAFMPLAITFLIFVSKNPEISKKLGIVGAKANLVAFASADWPAYMGLFKEMASVGVLLLTVFMLAWIIGREFADGTLKDMLAVPVQRSSILLAKMTVVAVWALVMALIMFAVGMVMGNLLRLPGDFASILGPTFVSVMVAACLTVIVVIPFAFFASIGRGEYFPWAVPMMFSDGKSSLEPVSFVIVFLTGAIGMIVTYLWWKYADQNR